MEKKGWKRTAIIFICLFIFVVVSVVGLVSIGTEDLQEREKKICAQEICIDYTYYDYSFYEARCLCFDENYNLEKTYYFD